MATSALDERTYEPGGVEGLARVYDFLLARREAGDGEPAPRYLLAGAGMHEQIELPEEVYRVMVQVVEAMRQGLAVTVSPRSQTLTTQQAADLIGVSRPTLIKLLDNGAIGYTRVSSHRRLRLRDVLDYMERRRAAQYAALAALSEAIDEGDDPAEITAGLRAARTEVAGRRRRSKE